MWHLKEAIDILLYGPKQAEIEYVKVPPVVEYKVVEVPAGRIAQRWSKETKDAVATLNAHPGFLAILDRFAWQRAMLENKLSHEYRKDIRESDWLQAGVFWLGYAQQLVDQATATPRRAQRDAMEEEMEAFRQLDANIERIGMDSQSPE